LTEPEAVASLPKEQAILARYLGWGGPNNAFPKPTKGACKDQGSKRGAELREPMIDEEFGALC
jgi:hypothetical protein